MTIKARHLLRREHRLGLVTPDAPKAEWYVITDPHYAHDPRKLLANERVMLRGGKPSVRLTPKQARFYIDQGVLQKAPPSEQVVIHDGPKPGSAATQKPWGAPMTAAQQADRDRPRIAPAAAQQPVRPTVTRRG